MRYLCGFGGYAATCLALMLVGMGCGGGEPGHSDQGAGGTGSAPVLPDEDGRDGAARDSATGDGGVGPAQDSGSDAGGGSTQAVEIGAEGGTVTLGDLTLEVPAGALAAPTQLRVTRSAQTVPHGYTAFSELYRFEPEGLQFTKPVTVSIPFDGDATRATVFWSTSGPAYEWLPSTVDGTRASAEVTHFSSAFVGDGIIYTDPTDLSCLAARILEGRTAAPPMTTSPDRPSNIAVVATVDDCAGNPVTELGPDDFEVLEDGHRLSSEAVGPVVLPRAGAETFVTLALDLSNSTRELRADLFAAAQLFVDQIRTRIPERMQISLEAFAEDEHSIVWMPHTLDLEAVSSALASPPEIGGAQAAPVPPDTESCQAMTKSPLSSISGSSTNLHGAVIDGLDRLDAAQASFSNRNYGGATTSGYLVLFSDGHDSASYRTQQDALMREGMSQVQVLAAGFKSEDYDPVALKKLAPNGSFTALSPSRLQAAFGALANRLAGQIKRSYVLGYCSPARGGMHSVSVNVRGMSAPTPSTWAFTADDFADGCVIDDFEAACDGKECGGFACGACDDRTSACDQASGRCIDACETQHACGGRDITVAGKYRRRCDDTVDRTSCGGQCVDLRSSEAHCGGCNHACPNDDTVDSTCDQGTCRCPESPAATCDDVCVDLATDSNNCGSCGESCDGICVQGTCDHAVDVAMSHSYRCAVMQSGKLACWGQLGQTGTERLSPTFVAGIVNAKAAALGDSHACVLRQSGQVSCWGRRVSNGTATNSDVPVDVTGLNNAVEIAAAESHTCAIRSGGQVVCWGEANEPLLVLGSATAESTSPIDVPGVDDAVHLATADFHTCALRSGGGLVCWGENDWSELGFEGPSDGLPHDAVGIASAQIALAQSRTCMLTTSGSIACMGTRLDPNGVPVGEDEPAPIVGLDGDDFVQVLAGGDLTCGVRIDGRMTCASEFKSVAGGGCIKGVHRWTVEVTGIRDLARVALNPGAHGGCAVTEQGNLGCWGAVNSFDGATVPVTGSAW